MGYLERELDVATHALMEEHRRACARCDGLVRDIEALTVQASALPSLTPARDLWPEIEARLETPVVPLLRPPANTTNERAATVMAPTRRVVSLRMFAVAATMLIAVTSTVTWQMARTRATTADSLATVASVANSNIVPVVNAGAVYEQEIAALRTIVNERFAELDSTTVEVLRRNLAIIDQAIADSRQALEKDPASRVLSTSLDRALESKLALMRRVALL